MTETPAGDEDQEASASPDESSPEEVPDDTSPDAPDSNPGGGTDAPESRVRDDREVADGREAPDDVGATEGDEDASARREIPEDVRKYERFKKIDGAQYDRANRFLRDRTYITAREWAIARLCSDFRTETGVEMTKIGENLPELVPFMEDTYTPQAVNQARAAFEEKVRKAGATFLYGAMCDFFTAEELDDIMYETTEVAKFLLEVEGVDLSVEQELEAEERISSVMREVRRASSELREQETETETSADDD
ncbi:DUF5806 family protein [Halomarina halobia]|uniref:DUF5806 family protein n=1 Tax=Halomarina halobia TaxID=3033386 RepID=A0ABD6AAN5_9EURY|nr:DUF5806 family protein [Halomarina sp. PSR21]